MNSINGKQHQEISLNPSRINQASKWIEIAALIGLGMLAITLHARLRLGLNMPGHHGILFMTIMMAARCKSENKFAASLMSLGVAGMVFIPFLGFKDPFIALIYLLPGFTLDLVYNRFSKKNFFIIAVFGGLAYMMIPFSRFIIHLLTGYPYGAFVKFGYLLPHLSHFAFGLTGSTAGFGIYRIIRKK